MLSSESREITYSYVVSAASVPVGESIHGWSGLWMRDGGDASCSQNQGMRCVLSNVFGIADFLEIFSDQRTALDRPSHFISKLFNLYSSGNCGKDKHDAIQGIFSRTVGWSTIYSDREISDSTSLFICIRKTYPLQENRPQPNQGKDHVLQGQPDFFALKNPVCTKNPDFLQRISRTTLIMNSCSKQL